MEVLVEVNFSAKFLCQLFFPVIQYFLGWGCTFKFVCIVMCSLVFIAVKVPETKGLSLEEIQLKLNGMDRSSFGNNKVKRVEPNVFENSKPSFDSDCLKSRHIDSMAYQLLFSLLAQ